MIVSISRELGAGGGTVGDAVAKQLGADLLDEQSITTELAKRMRFSPDYLSKATERPPTLGSILMSDLARSSAMLAGMNVWRLPEEEIIESVRQLVRERAEAGHVVVIGHGGRSLLGWKPSGLSTLSILLHAGSEWRIEQLTRRFGIDAAEAKRRVEHTDEARVRYQKYFFDSDMYDSRLYDLVLNTEALGLEMAIRVTTAAVGRAAGAAV
jgi:cytidylate kinase